MVLFNRRKYMGVRRSPQGAPLNLADAVITVAASVQYTGSPRTPSVTVVYEGTTLVANTDYFVAYNDNTNVGAATVVVTGTGSFTGTVVKTFHILSSGGGGGGTWDEIDITDASQVSTTGSVSGGTMPFCVRGGYLYSANIEGGVYRWQYDPAEASFSSDSSSTRSNGYCYGFCVARNGLHSYMYIAYSGYQTVYMYDHATEWDLSDTDNHYWNHGKNIPYSIPKKTGWSNDIVCGVDISADGTKLFTLQQSGYLHAHVLSTPFDVTSASSDTMVLKDLYTVAGLNQFRGMQMSQDGKRMVTISDDGVIRMWSLGTAWDISTISIESGQSFNTGLGSSVTYYGVGISDDGSLLFVKTSGNPNIRVYDLS